MAATLNRAHELEAPVPSRPERIGARARLPRLRYGWPLDLVFYGFAVFWALGVSAFIWPVVAVPLAARLVMTRPIRVPRGAGIWALYLAWTTLSFSQLDQASQAFGFIYRLSLYASALVIFVFIYNAPRNLIPLRRVYSWCVALWLTVVAGGWLGVLVPNFSEPSLFQQVLPGGLASDDFVVQLTQLSSAQVQDFLGYPLGRPQAPFPYTNHWGSVFALLLPVVVLGWAPLSRRSKGLAAPLILTASLVPAIVSLNRGMFLSLAVALVYASVRSGQTARRSRAMLAMVVVGLIALAVFTPAGQLIADREENQHSNEGRTTLYQESVVVAARSPLLGHGAPQEYSGAGILPEVGTQGQIWLVMVAQGFIGLALYLGFLGSLARSTRRLPSRVAVVHYVVVITLVQMFVYELNTAPHHILFLLGGVALRERNHDLDQSPHLSRAGHG